MKCVEEMKCCAHRKYLLNLLALIPIVTTIRTCVSAVLMATQT